VNDTEAPFTGDTNGLPRVAPPGRRSRSPYFSTIACPAPCEASQPRFHGSGVESFRSRRRSFAIARGGSFAPTRSARTPPVAGTLDQRRESAVDRRRDEAPPRPSRDSPPRWRFRNDPLTLGAQDRFHPGPQRARAHLRRDRSRSLVPEREGRLTASSAKKKPIRCTRGAFHPRDIPFRSSREASRIRGRAGIPRLSPTCGLPAWRLFVPRRARHP